MRNNRISRIVNSGIVRMKNRRAVNLRPVLGLGLALAFLALASVAQAQTQQTQATGIVYDSTVGFAAGDYEALVKGAIGQIKTAMFVIIPLAFGIWIAIKLVKIVPKWMSTALRA